MNIRVCGHITKLNRLQRRALEKFATSGSILEVAEDMQLSEFTIRIILETAVETLGVKSLFSAVSLIKASFDSSHYEQ